MVKLEKSWKEKEKETKISFSPSEKKKKPTRIHRAAESTYKAKRQNSSRKVQIYSTNFYENHRIKI